MKNGRVGAFLAVNNGTVKGCVADVVFSAKNGGAGFVYENNATISNSVSLRCVAGKQTKGFYVRNGGSIVASGYIASRRARRKGKNGAEEYIFGNAELFISSDTPKKEIYSRLGLDSVRKAGASQGYRLIPDISANMHNIPADDGKIIRIETADDLKNMIEAVNSGDRNAASAHYILADDINMKGAQLKPIGDSESYPFSGKLDGNGKMISNFTIDCCGAEYGGFFGYAKDAEVANLALDYILKGNGGGSVGGMAGCISGGSFTNCHIRLSMSPGMCSGGFCGKNSGVIINCCVGGRIAPPVSVLPWLIPGLAVLLALIVIGSVIFIKKIRGNEFNPEIIDPNQVPVTRPDKEPELPPAGTNRISLELNHDVYISATTMVGQIDYVNPHRSTQDVVIKLCVSDAELKKAGYDLIDCGIRTQAEMDAEGYIPEKSFTVLYKSQRLQIGYKLGYCKLSPLPNGKTLKTGDYDMVMMIDAYDPKTNEKSIVNAQAETTIHIVDR